MRKIFLCFLPLFVACTTPLITQPPPAAPTQTVGNRTEMNECLRRDPMKNYRKMDEKPKLCFFVLLDVPANEYDHWMTMIQEGLQEWKGCGYIDFQTRFMWIYEGQKDVDAAFESIQEGETFLIVTDPLNFPAAQTALGVTITTKGKDDRMGTSDDKSAVFVGSNTPLSELVIRHEVGHRMGLAHIPETLMRAGGDWDHIPDEEESHIGPMDCNLVTARYSNGGYDPDLFDKAVP